MHPLKSINNNSTKHKKLIVLKKDKRLNLGIKKASYKLLNLKNENLLLRQVLTASTNPIRITSKRGEIIYVNPAWEKLTGYLFEEVKGKNTKFLKSGKTPEFVYKKLREALRTNSPFTTEEIIDKRKDGSFYQLYSSMYPVQTDSNTTLLVQIHHDITTRKRREELEHRLASLVQFSNDAILGISPDMKFTSWNPAARRLYGFTDKEVLGKPISIIIPNYLQGEEKRLLIENPVLDHETIRIKKDGKFITVLITTSPIKDKEGEIVGYSAIHHDITQHKLTTDKLIESERRFKAVFSSMFQFIGLLSPEGILIEANKTALSFIKSIQKDVVGSLFWDLPWWSFSKEGQRQLRSAIKKAQKGKFVRYEAECKNLQGKNNITLDFSLTPIKDDQGKIVLIIAEGRDITDRKILEQQKSNFLSIASHELKTPITTLRLMMEVFLRKFKNKGIETKELQIVNRELTRLTDLIKELLDISRIESGKMHLEMENTDLAELISQVIQKMKFLAGKRKFVFNNSAKCKAFCDANRIEEVLTNLIINAIKYSPENSTIIINLKTNKNNLIISVKDSGLGISKTDLIHIFDRYYQVNERSKGFGLGLYISHEIIMRHKGKIQAKSTLGKGSTFSFSLPRLI